MACFAVSAAEALIVKGVEKHQEKAYSHAELRNIFSVNRQISLQDIV